MTNRIISIVLSVATCIALSACGPSLSETGIPTEGRIISVRQSGTGTKMKSWITVNFFTQPDKENPKPEKPKDTNRTIDEIINDLTIDVNIGDYETAEIQVPSSAYSDYYEGQLVKIKYEKGNPSHAIIDQ